MEHYGIELDQVTRVYGRGAERTIAVNGVSLDIQPGEILCLLGPNGAGKTTLMGLLALLAAPTRGNLYFGGTDVRQLRGRARAALQRRIALVPETPFVYNMLTGREFLRFVGELYRTPRPELEARLASLLALFELEAAADRLLRTYSQGMLKKVVLTAALANDPAILLLDEPTNGLDPAAAAAVEALLSHERQQGKTIVLSTHNLDVAERLSNRAAILDRGRLVSVEPVTPAAAREERSRLERKFFEVTASRSESCTPS